MTFGTKLLNGIGAIGYSYRSAFGRFTPLLNSNVRMSQLVKDKYDLVIYGATGFTGQFVVEEVARVASLEEKKGQALKWAVAGRNKEKLLSVLSTSGKYLGCNLDDIEVIEADSGNIKSLNNMALQAKVVINCVGPYYLYGEPVVKACIENGANHVDISGEPQFMEGMQLKYDEAAEKAGVHIVNACGYDSVPADVGVCHMMNNFPGTLNSVECFVATRGGKNSSVHTGTMESAALFLANKNQVADIRKQLFPKKLPKPKYKKEKRGVLHKNPDVDKWCLPLPSDESAVFRTQNYLHNAKGLRPVQFQGFAAFNSLFASVAVMMGAMYFITLCLFGWTRKLLFKYPRAMTAGFFTKEGASREQLENMTFTSTLVGKGWKEKLSETSDEYAHPPDSKIIVKISGKDPGYASTSLMMVASAMTILREKSKLQRPGGVVSPGTAFMDTKIVDRMIERGMTVSVQVE